MHKKSVILYDGYCNLCSSSIRFIKKRDKHKVFTYRPLQTEEPTSQIPVKKDPPETIILMEDDKIFQLSDAVLRIFRRLRFPWNLLYIFIIVPSSLRDPIYRFIAKNRYKWFGRNDSCYLA